MPLLLILVFAVLLVIALIPVSLVQRFRAGTARRPARRWVATLNLAAVALSIALFLTSAALTAIWVPDALVYTLAGLAAGAVLGIAGYLLTHWERIGDRLHYTPNRLLVLAITLVVAARVVYGFWRSVETWRVSTDSVAWIAASGLSASMSAGAVVLGYYLVFWTAIRSRID